MNSEFVMEQSKRIADRAREHSNQTAVETIERCFELILGRQPSDSEREACLEIKDLTLVCRALINSNEFAFLQ